GDLVVIGIFANQPLHLRRVARKTRRGGGGLHWRRSAGAGGQDGGAEKREAEKAATGKRHGGGILKFCHSLRQSLGFRQVFRKAVVGNSRRDAAATCFKSDIPRAI